MKIDGTWKIASDQYEDYLWRWLKMTRQDVAELQKQFSGLPGAASPSGGEVIPSYRGTTPYDRQGAIDYAHQWSIAPRPYNSMYTDFTDLGGDCTNFVSQAMVEGGKIAMVFGGMHGVGTVGWYYYDIQDRAIAWTWVDGLYNFIVHEHALWDEQLVGAEVGSHQVLAGDILQFNWGSDPVWDHSVLIVSSPPHQPENPLHLVAGHSPDVDRYPYTTMVYSPSFRFIHIFSAEAQHPVTENPPTAEIVATPTPRCQACISTSCPSSSGFPKRLCRIRCKP